MTQCDAFERVDKRRLSSLRCSKGFCPRKKKKRGKLEMSTLGGPRDGGGPPARALLPALQTRATPRRCPRTSTVDHDQSPSTATARSLEYPSVTTDEAQLKIRASVPTGAASNTTREDADTTTTTTTGIHATDQLLVSTTPYHPRNGSAPCLDDALLRAPLPPSTSRERSTERDYSVHHHLLC